MTDPETVYFESEPFARDLTEHFTQATRKAIADRQQQTQEETQKEPRCKSTRT